MTDLDVDLAKAKAAFDATPEPGEVKPPAPQKKKKAKKKHGRPQKGSQDPLISRSDAAETPAPPAAAPAPTPPVFGDEILTIDGTAAFLKVSRRQVYLMLKNEELPARRVGKRWRFSQAALSAYVAGEK
jgi:excisionase family DNA binding protein